VLKFRVPRPPCSHAIPFFRNFKIPHYRGNARRIYARAPGKNTDDGVGKKLLHISVADACCTALCSAKRQIYKWRSRNLMMKSTRMLLSSVTMTKAAQSSFISYTASEGNRIKNSQKGNMRINVLPSFAIHSHLLACLTSNYSLKMVQNSDMFS